jgi:hypothetical protein
MPNNPPYHDETLATKMARTFSKFIDVPSSPTQIINHIRKISGTDTVITTARSEHVDPNDINVNAFYDPDADEDDDPPFEVSVVFNPNDKTVTMDKDGWKNFTSTLIDYLEHEMVHRNQYRARDFKPGKMYRSKAIDPTIKKQQEYLGNTDEIDAYAHNLTSEILRKTGGDHERALRLLRNFAGTAMTKDQAGRLLSTTLYGYFKDFGFDTTHPVLKRLMKKTYQNIQAKKKVEDRVQRVAKRNADIEEDNRRFLERQDALDKQSNTSYTAIISN